MEEILAALHNNGVAALLHQSGEGDLMVIDNLVKLRATRNGQGQGTGAARILDGTGAALNQHNACVGVVVQQLGRGKKLQIIRVLNGRGVAMLHEAGDLRVSLKVGLDPAQKTVKSVNVGAKRNHQIVRLRRDANRCDSGGKYGQIELGGIDTDLGEVLNRHRLFLSMYLSVVTPHTRCKNPEGIVWIYVVVSCRREW